MSFLMNLEFTQEEIDSFVANNPEVLVNLIVNSKKIVLVNLNYLKNYGIENYKEIFLKFSETFLLDHSSFIEIFDKYEATDLIEKLKKNISIYEYL